jgi:hypothetical protein
MVGNQASMLAVKERKVMSFKKEEEKNKILNIVPRETGNTLLIATT